MPPKKKGPPWLGKLTGIDLVLARLDEIEAKLDDVILAIDAEMTSSASLKASLDALKAADKTIDAIEPAPGGPSK